MFTETAKIQHPNTAKHLCTISRQFTPDCLRRPPLYVAVQTPLYEYRRLLVAETGTNAPVRFAPADRRIRKSSPMHMCIRDPDTCGVPTANCMQAVLNRINSASRGIFSVQVHCVALKTDRWFPWVQPGWFWGWMAVAICRLGCAGFLKACALMSYGLDLLISFVGISVSVYIYFLLITFVIVKSI